MFSAVLVRLSVVVISVTAVRGFADDQVAKGLEALRGSANTPRICQVLLMPYTLETQLTQTADHPLSSYFARLSLALSDSTFGLITHLWGYQGPESLDYLKNYLAQLRSADPRTQQRKLRVEKFCMLFSDAVFFKADVQLAEFFSELDRLHVELSRLIFQSGFAHEGLMNSEFFDRLVSNEDPFQLEPIFTQLRHIWDQLPVSVRTDALSWLRTTMSEETAVNSPRFWVHVFKTYGFSELPPLEEPYGGTTPLRSHENLMYRLRRAIGF